MYELDEVLALYGGLLRHRKLSQSVERTLDEYKQLSGVNPIFIPNLRRKIETSGPSRFAGFYFVEAWSCNAAVALSADQPIFICNAGFPFIVYDYLSRLLACPQVLRDFHSEQEDPANKQRVFADRFDYKELFSGTLPDILNERSAELIRQMFSSKDENKDTGYLSPLVTELADGWRRHLPYRPINPKRRGLVTYLVHIVNAFLFGHEACHISNGHLEFLRRRYGVLDLVEFNIASSSRHNKIDNHVYQAMEYEADLAGLRNTLRFKDDDLPLDRFWEFTFIRRLSIQDRARIWMFSLSAFFCLLEWERTKSKPRFSWLSYTNRKHPNSMLRLKNIVEHSVSAVTFDDESGFNLEEFLKMSTIDFSDLTECLGISKSFHDVRKAENTPEYGRDIMDSLREELEDCVRSIHHMYYVGGKKAEEVDINKAATDPYHLRGQHAEIYHEGGVVEKRYFDMGIAEFYDKDGKLLRRAELK